MDSKPEPADRDAEQDVRSWTEWLTWLESPKGIAHRESKGGLGNDLDFVGTIPSPTGGASIITVGDVRAVTTLLDRLRDAEAGRERAERELTECERDYKALRYWWDLNPSLLQHRIKSAETELAVLRRRATVPEDVESAAKRINQFEEWLDDKQTRRPDPYFKTPFNWHADIKTVAAWVSSLAGGGEGAGR